MRSGQQQLYSRLRHFHRRVASRKQATELLHYRLLSFAIFGLVKRAGTGKQLPAFTVIHTINPSDFQSEG